MRPRPVAPRLRRWPLPLSLALAMTTASNARPQPVRDLRADPAVDLTITGVGGALYLASVLLHGELAPTHCRWCGVDSLDLRARDALVWSEPATAAELSNVGLALSPISAFGLDALASAHDHASRGVGVDVLVIAEATILALDLNELGKLVAARERPYSRAMRLTGVDRVPAGDDGLLSFYSGHTTATFALAAATGTVATMRGYRWAPVPWVVGGGLAAGTGYLRVAADRHWLTDVLVGMATGVAMGIAVPLLFHSPSPAGAALEPR